MKKLVIAVALLVLVYQFATREGPLSNSAVRGGGSATSAPASVEREPAGAEATSDALAQAYARRQSNVQVQSEGVIQKVLKDDDDGSRHQRILVRLASGQTVLIAHNIDIAARVESPQEGDTISFAGEYEWNERGGIVHWTHRDPAGRHAAGWIRYAGRMYR